MDFTDKYNPPLKMANKKFNEKQVLARVSEYINSTYSKHYAQGGKQATELKMNRNPEYTKQ
jgi:hypothetical protein